jgi:hypothetical protein
MGKGLELPQDYPLPATRGYNFYGETEVEVLEKVLAWRKANKVSLHVIKFEVSGTGEEVATVFYEGPETYAEENHTPGAPGVN